MRSSRPRGVLEPLVWLHRLDRQLGLGDHPDARSARRSSLPLTYKSLKAAALMRRVQPEILQVSSAATRTIRRRLNAEMMALV